MTPELGVPKTILLVGLNRSGTTALVQAFLNRPGVEVFKDPGKYDYEISGALDFSHFFLPAMTATTEARVIKQSIGPNTLDLCTLPIFPIGANRAALIRSVHVIFLVRDPREVWRSWQAMTTWLNQSLDRSVVDKWEQVEHDHGTERGWGSYGLFRLAWLYFYELYAQVTRLSPDATVHVPWCCLGWRVRRGWGLVVARRRS